MDSTTLRVEVGGFFTTYTAGAGWVSADPSVGRFLNEHCTPPDAADIAHAHDLAVAQYGGQVVLVTAEEPAPEPSYTQALEASAEAEEHPAPHE